MRFFALKGVAEVVGIVMVRERRVLRSFIVDGEGPLPSRLVGVFIVSPRGGLQAVAEAIFRASVAYKTRVGENSW
jgi:hypothetical protein